MRTTCWRCSQRWRPQPRNLIMNASTASTLSMLWKSLPSFCKSIRQLFRSRAKRTRNKHWLSNSRYSKTEASLKALLERTSGSRTWFECSKVSCLRNHLSTQVLWSYRERWPRNTFKSITMPNRHNNKQTSRLARMEYRAKEVFNMDLMVSRLTNQGDQRKR